MVLTVYNTLTRQKEEFKPQSGRRVYMFVCGPTTYDHSHLGHARTYVAFDVIARYLRYKGFDLFYLMNITDIDDNIINRAKELDMEEVKLAEKFFKLFIQDMAALNIKSVNLYAKATEHVPEIIAQANTLIDKGFAYEVDGNVYYEVRKFTDFGKLSGQNLDSLQAGARINIDQTKRNPEDFVLWKKAKPGEPIWNSPWGEGRPGWHIEDTAITTKYFGDQYDIHGGARDLIFPHHESEITIAESATGKQPFVRYWLHTGFLNVEGDKMSKSLGNFFTIQEVLEKYDAEVVRYFLLYTHYRSPIDFTESFLAEAATSYGRLVNSYQELLSALKTAPETAEVSQMDQRFIDTIKGQRDKFIKAMDDDFNTREAIAVLFEISKIINKTITPGTGGQEHTQVSKGALEQVQAYFLELGQILGLFEQTGIGDGAKGMSEKLIQLLIDLRQKLRENKNFELSDEIRDTLKELGIILEDAKDTTRWKLA
ncbi:cysteine--tRNA ligase [[Eubacterium] cellulosolvens]